MKEIEYIYALNQRLLAIYTRMKQILNTLFAINKLKGGFYSFFFASWIVTPIVLYFNKYIFSDWEFFISLTVLIFVDTILGWMKHWKAGTVSSSGWGKLITKLITYACFLILTHVITHFKIAGSNNDIFTWFDNLAYSAIIVRESISILENMAALSPGLIPDRVLKVLKVYDKTGKVIKEDNEQS